MIFLIEFFSEVTLRMPAFDVEPLEGNICMYFFN